MKRNLWVCLCIVLLSGLWIGEGFGQEGGEWRNSWNREECLTAFLDCLQQYDSEVQQVFHCARQSAPKNIDDPFCVIAESEPNSPAKSTLGVQWKVLAAPPIPKDDALLLPFD